MRLLLPSCPRPPSSTSSLPRAQRQAAVPRAPPAAAVTDGRAGSDLSAGGSLGTRCTLDYARLQAGGPESADPDLSERLRARPSPHTKEAVLAIGPLGEQLASPNVIRPRASSAFSCARQLGEPTAVEHRLLLVQAILRIILRALRVAGELHSLQTTASHLMLRAAHRDHFSRPWHHRLEMLSCGAGGAARHLRPPSGSEASHHHQKLLHNVSPLPEHPPSARSHRHVSFLTKCAALPSLPNQAIPLQHPRLTLHGSHPSRWLPSRTHETRLVDPAQPDVCHRCPK